MNARRKLFFFGKGGGAALDPAITGGEVTDITIEGVNYRVHTFNSSEDLIVNTDVEIDYVLVGGGGGAGCSQDGQTKGGGGGGAGGLVLIQNEFITKGTYQIQIGSGGLGRDVSDGPGRGTDGSDSIVFGKTALGGGSGGFYDGNNVSENGNDGGSGGGARGGSGNAGIGLQPTHPNGGFGNNGNEAPGGNRAGGAGGGGAGEDADFPTRSGGDGLDVSYLFGNSIGEDGWLAGGGGGTSGTANETLGEHGGKGGGGKGSSESSPNAAENGLPNTGGGGGGGHEFPSGNGGSGVLILRYRI